MSQPELHACTKSAKIEFGNDADVPARKRGNNFPVLYFSNETANGGYMGKHFETKYTTEVNRKIFLKGKLTFTFYTAKSR